MGGRQPGESVRWAGKTGRLGWVKMLVKSSLRVKFRTAASTSLRWRPGPLYYNAPPMPASRSFAAAKGAGNPIPSHGSSIRYPRFSKMVAPNEGICRAGNRLCCRTDRQSVRYQTRYKFLHGEIQAFTDPLAIRPTDATLTVTLLVIHSIKGMLLVKAWLSDTFRGKNGCRHHSHRATDRPMTPGCDALSSSNWRVTRQLVCWKWHGPLPGSRPMLRRRNSQVVPTRRTP